MLRPGEPAPPHTLWLAQVSDQCLDLRLAKNILPFRHGFTEQVMAVTSRYGLPTSPVMIFVRMVSLLERTAVVRSGELTCIAFAKGPSPLPPVPWHKRQ